uniref:Importin subunit alpha n=1 Tax=Panagrolaimus sp. JU765 TaxID=591449 RepID=A0AC34QFN8_9BILA
MAENIEERSKMYKNVGKAEQETSRRRRTEQTIELRRQKRGDVLNKRRNIDPEADYESESTDVDKAVHPKFSCSLSEARELLLNNPSPETLRQVFEHIRRLLSRGSNPPIDEVVNEGLVVALVQALGVNDEKVQFEAAWGLTNVVSGTTKHTEAAVNAGATQALVNLIRASNSQKLVEQCFWAVANIMGDNAMFRDHAINCGVLEVLINYADNLEQLNLTLVKTIAWVFSNVCRHKNPQISFEKIEMIIPSLVKLLKFKDQETRQDTCWSVSYLTDGDDSILPLLLKTDILSSVEAMLMSNVDKLAAPALRVFGNFVSGDDNVTQIIIDTGIIKNALPGLLKRSGTVLKEACWLLSNVLAGTVDQIQSVIDAGLIPELVNLLDRSDFKVKGECAWALANLCHAGTQPQIYQLAQTPILTVIGNHLNVRHVEFLLNLLNIVASVLNAVANLKPEALESYVNAFEEAGGVSYIEELQNHENPKIYDSCYEIISRYYSEDQDENNPNISQEAPVFNF